MGYLVQSILPGDTWWLITLIILAGLGTVVTVTFFGLLAIFDFKAVRQWVHLGVAAFPVIRMLRKMRKLSKLR